ncbi:hypothetical protein BDA99DRAFT_566378 [Phascolomyces articulosus]|uniref:Uncharacterized protein n=1 Tax=Phascolomyces articulosus TaxID=60185 RepID=A0AAD5JKW1_9FUNG|nr:hypothetical protein BDA99DRAFT_566378 [Phascolomyces articulosus]
MQNESNILDDDSTCNNNNNVVEGSLNNEEGEGVIQVTYANEMDDEPELQRLRRIKQFQPLIKESERSFGLENLLGITIGLKGLSNNMKEDKSFEVNHTHLAELMLDLQKHTENYKRKIYQDQKLLLQRLKHVEGLSVQTAQSLVLGLNQARHASEKLEEAKKIKAYAQQTQKQAADILHRLCAIEKHLAPEDRIGHESFTKRWPDLDKLYRTAKEEQQHCRPPLDIMKMPLRSTSADPSLTTVTKVVAEGTSSIHDDDNKNSITSSSCNSDDDGGNS